MNFLLFSIVFLNFIPPRQSLQQCGPSYCNHEGQCTVEQNANVCKCIGSKYFQGPQCLDKIDHCNPNPCANGGQCHSLVGQYLCLNCNAGYGGMRCDVKLDKLFRNMILMFQHYATYGKPHKFMLILEDLGSVPFSVEFVADNYVIDSFECDPQKKQSFWIYSSDLPKTLDNQKIRHHNDLPFGKGYYHLMDETFWNADTLELTLNVYDSETAEQLLHSQTFDLLINTKDSMKCVPKVKFNHGSNPLDPLKVDIARFNNFEFQILQRCQEDSNVQFKWSIFDSTGKKKLHDFGNRRITMLKVPPYRLWFNYHGSVVSSYSLVVTVIEKWAKHTAKTEGRCFIMVLPKPVQASIRGGHRREHGVGQTLILDASESRDFALSPRVKQNLNYHWSCTSVDDAGNSACNKLTQKSEKLQIKPKQLKVDATYKFSLTIQSKVNVNVSDVTVQTILVVNEPRLFLNIQCIRNCLRNHFNSGKDIHLRVQRSQEISSKSQIKWNIDGSIQGSGLDFIYTAITDAASLDITVEVKQKNLIGKSSVDLVKNKAPTGGHCIVEPTEGKTFHTEFHIQCEDYVDTETPLTYHYSADDFPLEMINDPDVHVHLPVCSTLKVEICDQLDGCTETILPITVSPLEKPDNLEIFLQQKNSNINELLKNGDRLTAIILLKSLISYINTDQLLLQLMNAAEKLDILKLVELEQWLSMAKDLVQSLLPLTNEKSLAMLDVYTKLHIGLELMQNSKEVHDISLKSFEKALQNLAHMLGQFSQTWETLPAMNAKPQITGTSKDPIAEAYAELPDFDIFVLEKIANWLETSRLLHKCFETFCSQASFLYSPNENSTISAEENKTTIQLKAVDEIQKQRFGNPSIVFEYSEAGREEEEFIEFSITLQMTSMNYNPFWWYPSDRTLSSDVFGASIYSSSSETLKKSLTFQLPSMEIEDPLPSVQTISVSLSNPLHMPIFILQIQPNAAVLVKFSQAVENVFLGVSFGMRPRSFEVASSKKSSVSSINNEDELKTAYIAVLATLDKVKFPISLSLHVNVVECLYWDWNTKDPEWSTKGCQPKTLDNSFINLSCECSHLSMFSSKNYKSQPFEDLRNSQLLNELIINTHLIIFYGVRVAIFIILVLFNNHRCRCMHNILITSATDDRYDVEVQIYTGSLENAETTANIFLTFIMEMGSYHLTIYQDPGKPQLVQNSLCKCRLSSDNVQMPIKISIHHDQSGRYPSWFCHKINVLHLRAQKSQVFVINQWITHEPMGFSASKDITTLRDELHDQYVNWYEFQAILGPCKFTNLNCIIRCHIWIAYVILSVCIVACFYGPTSMENYEEERELYDYMRFTKHETVVIPLVCFLAGILLKFIYILFIPLID